ncbi:MAG TPA: ammonia-forming cytochrome c nitrite reductase subunit c552, partial [Anaerolineae bacterium]|nr:ammonia-forming cytochrome c nitrite reductase subunit c552 [Anaerolineae bacterium]
MTDSTQQPKSRRTRSVIFVGAAFIIGFALLIGIGALLMNINTRRQEAVAPNVKIVDIQDGETGPAVWGQNYPLEYDRFM